MDAFRNDPFFRNDLHRDFFSMDFPDFFGDRRQRHAAIGGGMGTQSLSPFGMMDPFQRMNEMMNNMHRLSSMPEMGSGNTGHTFSHSTVMQYSHNSRSGSEPKMYQASYSSQTGPEGVRETKKIERDSVTGTQKTSVSHQIGNRSHTIDKKYNYKTKEAEQIQLFNNLDEDDANEFDIEWRRKTERLDRMLNGGPTRPAPRGLPSSDHHEPYRRLSPTMSQRQGSEHPQRSPRFTPYVTRQYGNNDSGCSTSHGNPTPLNVGEEQQRPKKKRSSKVKFRHE